METKTGETSELQVNLLWGNVVLLVCGTARAVGYDLCVANCYVISSLGKGTIKIGLVVSFPLGTCARIGPRLGLAIRNFIDVGWG